jgi:hypothetical protein
MLQKTYEFFTKRVGIVNGDGSGHSADPNCSRLHCASGRRGRPHPSNFKIRASLKDSAGESALISSAVLHLVSVKPTSTNMNTSKPLHLHPCLSRSDHEPRTRLRFLFSVFIFRFAGPARKESSLLLRSSQGAPG